MILILMPPQMKLQLKPKKRILAQPIMTSITTRSILLKWIMCSIPIQEIKKDTGVVLH